MAIELTPVGEFAARHGVTIRALRLYEERGLLGPSIPRVKGAWRFYSEKEDARLATILRLKRCGLSLELIKAVLPRDLNGNFLLPLGRVREQLEFLRQQKRDIEEGIEELEGMEAQHTRNN